jgi:competence protein ComEC
MSTVGHVQPETAGAQPPALRHRPLVPVLAGFALGIALDNALAPAPWLWAGACGALVLLAFLAVRLRMREWSHWLLALLLMIPFGGLDQALRFRQKPAWHLKRLALDPQAACRVRGVVTREPELRRRWPAFPSLEPRAQPFWVLRVEARALDGQTGTWRTASGGMTVFVDGDRPAVAVGDTIEFTANLSHGRGPTNPGERDMVAAYEREGSYATASVPSPAAIAVLSHAPWYSPGAALGRVRVALSAQLEGILGKDAQPGRGSIVAALLFGRLGGLTPEQENVFRESGTLQFLAISGLHVGIFCAFVMGALTLTGVAVRPRLVLTLALVWCYVLFTGAPVPALRAGWTTTFLLAAPLVGRRRDSLSALFAAALVVLLVAPQQLFAAGFQLTFVAVWAILCIYPQLAGILWPWEDFLARARHPDERSLLYNLRVSSRSYLVLSCAVWAVTAPLLAYHFHLICLLAPLLNLVLWPLVLVLMLTCFLLAVCLPLAAVLAAPLVKLALFWSDRIETLLQWSSRLPGFGLYVPSPPLWWIALFFGLVGLWVLRWRLPAGRTAFVSAAVVLGLASLCGDVAVRRSHPFTLTVADVGQGQAVLAQLPDGQAVLFDAGSSSASRAAAVAEMLWHAHLSRLGAVLISHADNDHCSFLPFLLRRFGVSRALLPAAARLTPLAQCARQAVREAGSELHLLTEGAHLDAGEFECQVLHPDARFLVDAGLSENERSLVLHCAYRRLTFLLPGDVESNALKRLSREYGDQLKADVLLMPHHGHYLPELDEFVAHVRPAVAVISGPGQKDDATRQMLYAQGVSVWTTADHGAVIISLGDDGALVTGYRSGRSMRFEPSASPPVAVARLVGERSRDG